jgi:hypothetical protein
MRNPTIAEDRRDIIRLVIRLLRGWRATVASAVVTEGVELFAEGWPYIIPDGGIDYTVWRKTTAF